MSSYVIPVFPAASRVPPRDALAARLAELTGRFAELSSELAALASAVGSVSGKADKVPSAAAGNLASLDASGNLADSGATPASIKAAAVAEVVANAPGTMDTLKEIADILGSVQQSGTVLKRILDLESGKVNKEAGKGLVAVDSTLTQQGAAADANAVGYALRSGFTKWICDEISEGYTYNECVWGMVPQTHRMMWNCTVTKPGGDLQILTLSDNFYAVSLSNSADPQISLSRHLITPTKTSQLTNDGAPNGGGTPYATTEQIPDVSGKVDGDAVYPAWSAASYVEGQIVWHEGKAWIALNDTVPIDVPGDGSTWLEYNGTLYAQIRAKQDALSQPQLAAVNSGVTAAKVETWDGYAAQIAAKASLTDLPYALVTPGKWEFSDGVAHVLYGPSMLPDGWYYSFSDQGYSGYMSQFFSDDVGALNALVLNFFDGVDTITATRPSLPGHLLDRAGNRVVVSGATELTLPAAVPGYLRDFLVRLEISGSTVPTITFAAPTGETITYETDGDDFPVPDEAGSWLYSFTESCVAHKFAVSLKKVNEVAAPQAQGGS